MTFLIAIGGYLLPSDGGILGSILIGVGAFFGIRVTCRVSWDREVLKNQIIDAQVKLGHTMTEVAEAREVLRNTIAEMEKSKREFEEVQRKTFSFNSQAGLLKSLEDMIRELKEKVRKIEEKIRSFDNSFSSF